MGVRRSLGIDASNLTEILKSGLRAGGGKVHIAPHVFGAVKDKETKLTVTSKVLEIQEMIMAEVAG